MKSSFKNAFWKIYFSVFIGVVMLMYLDGWLRTHQIITISPRGLIADLIIIPLTILALYSYSFHKKIFAQTTWKAFFWLKIITFALFTYSDLVSTDSNLKLTSLAFITVLMMYDLIPLFVFYKLAYSKK